MKSRVLDIHQFGFKFSFATNRLQSALDGKLSLITNLNKLKTDVML